MHFITLKHSRHLVLVSSLTFLTLGSEPLEPAEDYLFLSIKCCRRRSHICDVWWLSPSENRHCFFNVLKVCFFFFGRMI